MQLDLYMFPSCPFCRRVIREIEQEGREDVIIHNIHENRQDYETLIKVGGMDQVPCLFIDGQPLYESADIIAWLQANPAN